MLPIINILYGVFLFVLVIMALFIVFHIVKYAYSKSSSFFMLMLFVPVVGVLIFINLTLFLKVDFVQIFAYLLKI